MKKKKRSSLGRFDIVRSASKDLRREHEQNIRFFKEAAVAAGPEYAAHKAHEMVLTQRRCWRRFLQRRFGVRIVNTDGNDRVVEVKNWPGRKLAERIDSGLRAQNDEDQKQLAREYEKEEWLFLFALKTHAVWELSRRVMLERGVRALDEPGAELWTVDEKRYWVSLAVVEGFILAQQIKDELWSIGFNPDTLSPTIREGVAAMLTGQTEAMISLTQNKRLSAVLGEGGGARKKLLEELPGAVIEVWSAAKAILAGGKYRTLVQRVARALERAGNESNYLERKGKLSLVVDMATADDELLEFERQEEARQKLDALEQKAKLSRQQVEIWRRLRRGMEIAEIASDLDIPGKQVSTQKKRIMHKMQRVRAAGF